jgi:alpha-tubulin suppressor-like RCC1 family protein
VIQVKAIKYNSALLTSSGKVWVAGINTNGQRGDGTTTVTGYFSQVVGLDNVVKIAGGMESSTLFAIAEDSVPITKAYVWGKNDYGKIPGVPIGDFQSTPVALDTKGCDVIDSAESIASVILVCSDGALLTHGTNHQGLLGLGYSDLTTRVSMPTKIPHEERFQRVYCTAWHCIAWASSGWALGYVWGVNA